MKRLFLSFALLLVCIASNGGDGKIHRFADPVRDRYIVVLQDDIPGSRVPETAQQMVQQHGGKVRYVMNHAINMFSVEMTEPQATALALNPLVKWVEEVGGVYLSTIQTLPPPSPLNWMVLWNLDRIDQWSTFDSNQYQYCEQARDVIAYVPDTGVMGDHQEFIDPATGLSRVRTGVAFAADGGTGNQICPLTGGRTADLGWSHGTAVASILGGRTVGVAKAVTIVPIRIYACQQDQGLIATTERLNWGLDWIRSANNPDRFRRPALVSLSTYVRPNDNLLAAHEAVINRIVLDGTTPDGFVWTGIAVIASANNHARTERPPVQEIR